MDELDRALARLAGAPIPTELDGMETRVLARIGPRPISPGARIGVGAVTVAALAIGVIGADLPATMNPAVSLAPLGGASPLAPSTLLIGAP